MIGRKEEKETKWIVGIIHSYDCLSFYGMLADDRITHLFRLWASRLQSVLKNLTQVFEQERGTAPFLFCSSLRSLEHCWAKPHYLQGMRPDLEGQACQGWDTGEELVGTWPGVRLRKAC